MALKEDSQLDLLTSRERRLSLGEIAKLLLEGVQRLLWLTNTFSFLNLLKVFFDMDPFSLSLHRTGCNIASV